MNTRLVWVLEEKNLISKFQCGFRENHSTNDHLVRFETFVHEAFARKRQVLAVFFDLEKAYDTTWKYGILQDLYKLDFRGRLPLFIQNFLTDRHFNVKTGNQFSDSYLQETGVPQGSILSPILFNLKINDIMRSVSSNVNASLFVDDFAIYMEGKHLQHLERTMQLCINRVHKWVSENGFKFSVMKTVCVHFHRQRIYQEPSLTLDGQAIPVREETKFLGVIFDKRMTFRSHILNLKRKAQRALNLLRVVGNTDWGADRDTLLKLYRTLVRSKLDYGCIIYGSAKKNILKMLDPIHHQGLRVALGAFRTSPIKSLYAEAGEPSLQHRREKLSMVYFMKLKSLPHNPCFESIKNHSSPEFFENKNSDPCFGARTNTHIKNAKINMNEIEENLLQKPPPWEQYNLNFDTSLAEFGKKTTNNVILEKEFLHIKQKYKNCYEIYTDGSKQEERVGAAAFFPDQPGEAVSARLADGSSIFSAELEGILMAIRKIKKMERRTKNFAIYIDSLSAVDAVKNKCYKNSRLLKIYDLIRNIQSHVYITFVWVPAHVGILGNESVDKIAKSALTKAVRDKQICWSDLKPKINTYLNYTWQNDWDEEIGNKLHEILPNLKENLPNRTSTNRRQETKMSRLRIGHTWLTHCYLLKNEDQPFCYACDSPLTVKHILIECSDFLHTREKYYKVTNLHALFREVNPSHIIEYLKEIGIYGKI